MLEGSTSHLKMVYSLVFSLGGVPVFRYGEEIGMGDDLSLPGRLGVRTPMQWSDEPNAGFSSAQPDRLIRPIVQDDTFGYRRVNVGQQENDPDSLLSFFRRLTAARKGCVAIGLGDQNVLDSGDPHVFAHRCDTTAERFIAFHNLSNAWREVSIEGESGGSGQLVDILGDQPYDSVDGSGGRFRMAPFGFRWLLARGL
jgi:maltose alpha-D-glucosyltransferase/alpha-amylase